MKWGVWNEETKARYLGGSRRSASRAKRIEKQLQKSEIADAKNKSKKAEKHQKKAAYLKELEEPGTTSLDMKYLKGKRLKNAAASVYTGFATATNLLAVPGGIASIPIHTLAWGPVAGPIIGIGTTAANLALAAGAGKLTVDSVRRAADLDATISNRNRNIKESS